MNRIKVTIKWVGIVLVCISSLSGLHAAELMVFAAASLTDVLQEIKVEYEAVSTDRVQFNFGGSGTLRRQIIEGAGADLFLSADEAQIDALAKVNLVDGGSRIELLSNTLVVVVPDDDTSTLDTIKDLTQPRFKRIAIAQPDIVPAGTYARDYLTRMQIWEQLVPRMVFTDNVRATLAAVESGNADAGVVYRTDALSSKRVRIVWSVARSEGPAISYPLVMLKACRNADAARQFMKYLQSDTARAIQIKHGFLPLTNP